MSDHHQTSIPWSTAIVVGGGLVLGMWIGTPAPVSAQIMVCQTPTFWCSFPGNAPSNLPCYCNTGFGRVNGYSINPNQQRPAPRPRPRPNDEEDDVNTTSDQATKDCLNGLGNCDGSYRNAIRRR